MNVPQNPLVDETMSAQTLENVRMVLDFIKLGGIERRGNCWPRTADGGMSLMMELCTEALEYELARPKVEPVTR